MAKKSINKRCPLAPECGRKTCEHVSLEYKCDYYKYNASGDSVIPDQEAILEQQRKQLDMEIDAALFESFEDENAGKLVYLSVDALSPHPRNPRQDLGDLTELANSIKEKGVMQNLTVVPGTRDDNYTVIIGHRRLAASKAAGLKTVPCVIVDMSYEDQIATMLLENIQRSDLTPYEQAQGFQLMIDLGETVETISLKTGFSKSTVRRRVKMAELDQNTLKKVSARQISIGDLDRLSEIEDEKERNKVLAHIGTNNFESEFKRAVNEQNRQKKYDLFRGPLFELGLTELEESDYKIHNHEKGVAAIESLVNDIVSFARELIEKGKTVFFKFSYDWIYIYTQKALYVNTNIPEVNTENDEQVADDKQQKTEELAEQERQEKLRQLKEIRKNALQEAFDRAYQLRFDYIRSFTEAKAKEYATQIIELNLRCAIEDIDYKDNKKFASIMNIDINGLENKIMEYDTYKETVTKSPFKSLLAYSYCFFDSDLAKCYDDEDLTYQGDEYLDFVYEQLAVFGYDPSDEEIQLLNGTFPLYIKENE